MNSELIFLSLLEECPCLPATCIYLALKVVDMTPWVPTSRDYWGSSLDSCCSLYAHQQYVPTICTSKLSKVVLSIYCV